MNTPSRTDSFSIHPDLVAGLCDPEIVKESAEYLVIRTPGLALDEVDALGTRISATAELQVGDTESENPSRVERSALFHIGAVAIETGDHVTARNIMTSLRQRGGRFEAGVLRLFNRVQN